VGNLIMRPRSCGFPRKWSAHSTSKKYENEIHFKEMHNSNLAQLIT
jgi:hypothetical protein